ncbi:DUF4389 domain-containing protein [Tersicoccus solisilvae]|uniref:DUF4389 domain-containing protein n=1 Tax=Tersicoccus solisilvae TaxID=1882339 RepID=UPI001E45D9FC|nr:DUF4389 domain-containing protein [Tersicoccus solisilvae]
MLVIGVLLTTTGFGLTVGGAVVLGADASRDDDGYIGSGTERYATSGYALTSPSLRLDLGNLSSTGAPALSDVVSVRLRVNPVVPGAQTFVGIGDTAAVTRYLDQVPVSAIATPGGGPRATDRSDDARVGLPVSGGDRAPAGPGSQDLWTISSHGAGTQELAMDLPSGDWTLVVMNADGSRPVWVDMQAAVRSPVVGPLGGGLLAAGLVGLVVGIPLLLLGAAGLGRDIAPDVPGPHPPGQPGSMASGGGGERLVPPSWPSPYPVWFQGFLDPRLSRGLWLVKWILGVPHYLVLALLWVAVLVTSLAAGLVVLVTGRYPRAWFAFTVGVLRWNWRVGFYAYSALGTDRYPPFSLDHADYPADLDVAYPGRLSHGLVLVKWWLLALPHLIIVALLTGGTVAAWRWWGTGAFGGGWSWSVLGVLVLVAGVILLIGRRYPRDLFDLVMGLNRWIHRVAAYVLLLRDEYPPFRLEQGPIDRPTPTKPPPPA